MLMALTADSTRPALNRALMEGTAMARSITMMPMTVSSSTRVKAASRGGTPGTTHWRASRQWHPTRGTGGQAGRGTRSRALTLTGSRGERGSAGRGQALAGKPPVAPGGSGHRRIAGRIGRLMVMGLFEQFVAVEVVEVVIVAVVVGIDGGFDVAPESVLAGGGEEGLFEAEPTALGEEVVFVE